MRLVKKALIPTALLSLVLGACGSSGPDVDQVKKDFENPSGSTQDKNGVIAASGKQSAADDNAALSLAGGGFLGFGLRSADRGDRNIGLAAISPARLFEPRARELYALYTGRTLRPLRTTDADIDDDCIDENAYREAVADAAGEREFSFEYSIDDLSACDDSLSGSVEFKVEAKVNDDNTSFEYKVEYKFNQVTDSSDGTKLDGSMVAEMTASTSGTGSFGQFKYVTAWDLTLTEDGRTLNTRGGIRFGYSGDDQNGQAEIEYLQYVPNGEGEEVSYVLTISSNTASGQTSLSIRGSDGEVNCTFNETTGAGECRGTGSAADFQLTWTDAEYDAVTSSEDFLGT